MSNTRDQNRSRVCGKGPTWWPHQMPRLTPIGHYPHTHQNSLIRRSTCIYFVLFTFVMNVCRNRSLFVAIILRKFPNSHALSITTSCQIGVPNFVNQSHLFRNMKPFWNNRFHWLNSQPCFLWVLETEITGVTSQWFDWWPWVCDNNWLLCCVTVTNNCLRACCVL